MFSKSFTTRDVLGSSPPTTPTSKPAPPSCQRPSTAACFSTVNRWPPCTNFEVGQPGSSFTFEVAEINGIGNKLIERAKGKLDARRVDWMTFWGTFHKEVEAGQIDEQTSPRGTGSGKGHSCCRAAQRPWRKERNLNAQFDALNTARVRSTKLESIHRPIPIWRSTRHCLRKSKRTSPRKMPALRNKP